MSPERVIEQVIIPVPGRKAVTARLERLASNTRRVPGRHGLELDEIAEPDLSIETSRTRPTSRSDRPPI